MNAVFQQKIFLNSVMRTLYLPSDFWISTFTETEISDICNHRPSQAIEIPCEGFICLYGIGVGLLPTLAQGLFVHQFRISGKDADQRVHTPFLHAAAAGCYRLLNYILELNLEHVFPLRSLINLCFTCIAFISLSHCKCGLATNTLMRRCV